jgi:large subunit ribosomal protein L30
MSAERAVAATDGGEMGESRLLVTQTRSAIGTKPKHRGTLRALGLRRIGASNLLPDRPEIRGMIARVPHLVTVEVVPTGLARLEPPGQARRQPAPSPEPPKLGAGKLGAVQAEVETSDAEKAGPAVAGPAVDGPAGDGPAEAGATEKEQQE